jgi:hypothetical protein
VSTSAARSRAAFCERFPGIAQELDTPEIQVASVVHEGGSAVDIAIDGKRIYGGDARRFAIEQAEAFAKKPLRVFMEQPGNAGLLSEVCHEMVRSISTVLKGHDLEEIERRPSGNPTFLVVFGIGLGHHLQPLIEASEARWLILVEPTLEFINASFDSLDWDRLCQTLEARGGNVSVIIERDPQRMVSTIVRRVSEEGIAFIDGAWVFIHYPLWSFTEARTRLHDGLQYAFINRGFFEDEIVMMSNAVANFTGAPFWLIEGRPRLQRAEMAAIVGAGPSLDESFETLHRLRDRIVLFSGGTSLRPLLRNGLVPDFHCELENVPEVVDVLSQAAQFGDLSKIRLIASATVDPRVPPLFAETFLFFRDSVSSTKLLGRELQILHGTAPTCVNSAAAAAVALGFKELLLFGTDCGIRPGGHHHASDTVYREVGIYKAAADEKAARYPLEVEGNFGGIAKTDWTYDSCRRMLGELIRAYGLTAVNCSDGALIPGARPAVPESIELNGPIVDRERFVAELKPSFRRFCPAELVADVDFPGMIVQTREFYRALVCELEGIDPDSADFAAVYRAMRHAIDESKADYANVDTMSSGTLNALPRLGMFYGYRMHDPAIRLEVFRSFMNGLRATLCDIERRTVELFEKLDDQVKAAAEKQAAVSVPAA